MTTKTDTAAAVENLRRAYWHLINVRDEWRHCDDVRLNLAAFRLHEGTQVIGDVLQRHLDLLAAGDLENEVTK